MSHTGTRHSANRTRGFPDVALFKDLVLAPYREAHFEAHTGPFLFEFQRHGMPAEEFLSRLDGFFTELPRIFRYAVEIRNSGAPWPGLLQHASCSRG
jgi:hypothetical protein